jgi:hypothetical protein
MTRIGGASGKKIIVVDSSGNQIDGATEAKQDSIIEVLSYEYMGDQTIGDYKYLGFKQNGGTNWKIMRKDNTDTSAWKYVYGTSGWSTAWADPSDVSITYSDPPNS